jgi:uncharacterized protein (DUF305 family)
MPSLSSHLPVACLSLLLTIGCTNQPVRTGPEPIPASSAAENAARTAAARANALLSRYPHTVADVRFMQGMIGHHSQAVTISRWAASHGASPTIQRLAERITVGQLDEIRIMQQWLAERNESAPDTSHHEHEAGAMPGMSPALMPGMLTPSQMAQLDAARGRDFDRLFLELMIQHHNGAVAMVEQLFQTHGAGQDDAIFKFASDVAADQSSEVARMERMLAEMSPEG